MGSAIKRGKTWTAVVNVWDSKRGENKRKWVGGFKNKKEASKYVYEKENGIIGEEDMSFSAFCKYYLKNYEEHLCQSTLDAYKPRIEKFIRPYFEMYKLSQIKSKHIQDYMTFLRGETTLSQQTIQHHYALVKSMLQKAVNWEMIRNNPAKGVKRPNVDKTKTVIWNADEMTRMIEAVKGDIIELPVVIAIQTGMRKGEILALKYSNIDFNRNMIYVWDSYGRIKEGKEKRGLKDTKSPAGVRAIDVPEGLIQLILQQGERQNQNRNLYREKYHESDFICTYKDGRLMQPAYLLRRFKKLSEEVGLPVINIHNLRHSHGSYLAENITPVAVQNRLGHASVRSSERYFHKSKFVGKKVVSILEKDIPIKS